MTGLNSHTDEILEIATAVTDSQLEEIIKGPVIPIYQPEYVLVLMDDWNQTHHTQSGLIGEVKQSSYDYSQAEERTLEFLERHVPMKKSPMCGSTICQDRRFLARLMPKLEQYFHYRHIDVSTLVELAQRWYPDLERTATLKRDEMHRAMPDVIASIEELRFYRARLFITRADNASVL